jgi:thiol:disulfide interchange protein DsbD
VAVQLGYKNVYRDPHGFPEWQQQGLPSESRPAGLAGEVQAAQSPGRMCGWAMIWTLLGVFVGGVALNLTPCVYPMIPITVSYFGGRAASTDRQGKRALVIHGLCYLLGLALTNSILGAGRLSARRIAHAEAGRRLGSFFGQRFWWILCPPISF